MNGNNEWNDYGNDSMNGQAAQGQHAEQEQQPAQGQQTAWEQGQHAGQQAARGQQMVYCREQPAPWMVRMIRSSRIFWIVWSVIQFALVVCIFVIKGSFIKGLLLAALLLLAGVRLVVSLFEKERIRSRITNEGIRTKAVLTDLSGAGSKREPWFDFYDERGRHHLPGYKKMKIDPAAHNQYIGRQYDIIYNPECPAAVMYAGMVNSNAGGIAGAVVGLAVILMAVSGVLLFSFTNLRTSEIREGDQMQIRWANTYEKSDFTQEDVDSDTVQWICAAYAIYTQYNNKELGIVGGVAEDDDTKDYAIRMALSDGWNITDRDSAIRVISRLLDKGHRQSYRELTEKMQKNGYLDLSEEMMQYRMNDSENMYTYSAAYRAWKAYGEHGIDAWDYCRALQVLGDCYQVEYINLEECLDQSLIIARTLQELYGSWDELAMSYLYGYQFWKNDDMESTLSDSGARMESYEILKNRLEGPYSIPYDTELTNTWEHPEAAPKDKKKSDSKGEYHSLLESGKGRDVLIKAPEGFVYNEEYSSKSALHFDDPDEQGVDQTRFFYMLENDSYQTDEEYEKNKVDYVKAVCENYDEPELQYLDLKKQQVDGLEVCYAGLERPDVNDRRQRIFYIWVRIDKECILTCQWNEWVKGEEQFRNEEELMNTLFGNEVIQY